ncbi:MAG: hypothetical protein KAR85_02605 [Methanosarcinales archaeon]|nr:hypothetical protein [Methanosarcinales archaeon]
MLVCDILSRLGGIYICRFGGGGWESPDVWLRGYFSGGAKGARTAKIGI